MVGHISPEAAIGGPIALIENGDIITIDAESNRVDLGVDEETLRARQEAWIRPKSSVNRGALAKYRAEVLSASQGAVTIAPPWDN